VFTPWLLKMRVSASQIQGFELVDTGDVERGIRGGSGIQCFHLTDAMPSWGIWPASPNISSLFEFSS